MSLSKKLNRGEVPSSAVYWTINAVDQNGIDYSKNVIGQFETTVGTGGHTQTHIRARQFVPGTNTSPITSTLYVRVDLDGTKSAGCDAPFYGAVWNDYAEYREANITEPGRVVYELGDDTLSLADSRMMPACSIISDTYGFAIGETEKCKTPLAQAGRVLAYPLEDRYSYKPGDAVCSGPNGTVSKMTQEEKVNYPECIIGYVSCVPNYEVWGEHDTKVNGRIWIKVV